MARDLRGRWCAGCTPGDLRAAHKVGRKLPARRRQGRRPWCEAFMPGGALALRDRMCASLRMGCMRQVTRGVHTSWHAGCTCQKARGSCTTGGTLLAHAKGRQVVHGWCTRWRDGCTLCGAQLAHQGGGVCTRWRVAYARGGAASALGGARLEHQVAHGLRASWRDSCTPGGTQNAQLAHQVARGMRGHSLDVQLEVHYV